MNFLFLIVITALVTFFINLYFWPGFLDNESVKSSDVASVVIGFLSALATCIAAWMARESAKTSRDAVSVADRSLKETQAVNVAARFENRYALLLQQHNEQHKQLCAFLDQSKKLHDRLSSHEWFLKNIVDSANIKIAKDKLEGHQVISPYMRTLYHLLKAAAEHTSLQDVVALRRYTSPVRSLIRNDVLILVAINSAVIHASDSEGNRVENDYKKYYDLLVAADLFSHALFWAYENPIVSENNDKVTTFLTDNFNHLVANHDIEHFLKYSFNNEVVKHYCNGSLVSYAMSRRYNNPVSEAIKIKIDEIIQSVGESMSTCLVSMNAKLSEKLKKLEDFNHVSLMPGDNGGGSYHLSNKDDRLGFYNDYLNSKELVEFKRNLNVFSLHNDHEFDSFYKMEVINAVIDYYDYKSLVEYGNTHFEELKKEYCKFASEKITLLEQTTAY